MLYNEHVESVIESLRRFANDKDTDLILLRNHLEQIICDVIVEIDKKVELGKEYERLYGAREWDSERKNNPFNT